MSRRPPTTLVAVPRGRVAHVAPHPPDDGEPATAACGVTGAPRLLEAGAVVMGGLHVCRACRRRSAAARTLDRAMREHAAGFVAGAWGDG